LIKLKIQEEINTLSKIIFGYEKEVKLDENKRYVVTRD
jgi:hypothetical protein